jgi:lysozyme
MMTASEKLKNLLADDWEKCILSVYRDSGGKPTIGVGHLLTKSELSSGKIYTDNETIRYHDGISKEQAMEILDDDLEEVEHHINLLVMVPLSQNQFDALVAFVFNIGGTAFAGSTLLRRLNAGLYDEVPPQLRRWIHDDGLIVTGLINRREKEIALWTSKT